MTTPSFFETLGLQIEVRQPLIMGGGKLFDLGSESMNAYSHEILAVGGFWTASIGLSLQLPDAEEWFENGLGRIICVYNQYGDLVWRGFVNQITLNAGAISEISGPLMDLGNRVSAAYTPMDFTVYPPVAGTATITTIAEDITSQQLYGIIEKIINVGQCTDTMAEQTRDIYLADNAYPPSSGENSFSPGGGSKIQVTLDCLGMIYWLNAYVYNNTGTGVYTVSEKIVDILAADPNGFISSNDLYIEANAFAVSEMESQNRFALEIVTELINLGNDTNDLRRIFGFYDEQDRAYYSTAPTVAEYQHFLADPAQRVMDVSNNLVYPWDVRPGKWLIVPDFLTGSSINPGTSPRRDRRMKFLESVQFTAPYSLNLSGGKFDRLSQLLAKLTYNGGLL